MHDNRALSPSPISNREQIPTPRLVDLHLPSSSDARKPFLKLDVDRLQKEVNGNANFQGVRAPLWVSHRDCATSAPEDHASTSFSQPNSGHAKKSAGRQSWSHFRYKGRPWQESLSDSQQEQIYEALKKQWGPYDEMKFRLGYREVRKLLDEKTARLILAGHKPTITDMGAKTNPYTMARKPTKVKKRMDLYWPDESIGIDQRCDSVARLDALWGTDTYATRKRLYKHYRPQMRSAFRGENEEEFRRVAEHIDKVSTLGRKTFQQAKGGRKRLRL